MTSGESGSTRSPPELKFRKFPTLPIEINRYRSELQHAADQLEKRLAFLDVNRRAAAQKTGYRGRPDDLQMFGFIVTAAQFGAGLKIGNFPVIDSDLFFEFFRLDSFFAMMEHQSLLDPKAFKIPLRTERGLSVDLIRHICNPLRIRWFEFGITEYQRTGKQIQEGLAKKTAEQENLLRSLKGRLKDLLRWQILVVDQKPQVVAEWIKDSISSSEIGRHIQVRKF